MKECPQPRLYRQLNEYCASDAYPFHMPGHKRQLGTGPAAGFPNPYHIDITEIDGFDNLHHAEGILKESMDWAASVYGAGRTYYLINGSTCGVMAAVCAAAKRGGTILMARNSHKSAYHAAALHGLNLRYIYPQVIEEFGLQGGLLPQDIEDMLTDGISAVFVTSPTYDGIVSDIRGIADVCHRHGALLIVDEAHGAHFPFGGMFPSSALRQGADIVIQSLHKTLPAFTQTALLHMREGLAEPERLAYYLQVFQSSSPSYVLMAGIERCIAYMADEGRLEMDRFAKRLEILRGRLGRMKRLRLLDRDMIGKYGVYDLDPSKIVVSARGVRDGLSGAELADILRGRYHLEMEMCGADYVTAITTLMDTEDGMNRLADAFLEMDDGLDSRPAGRGSRLNSVSPCGRDASVVSAGNVSVLPVYEAAEGTACCLELSQSVGRIAAGYVCLYPPGTPILVPGEMISREIVGQIRSYLRQGLPVQGLSGDENEMIRVLVQPPCL